MPQTYKTKDVDRILNEYAMPSDMVLLIDGLVHRIHELSDNDTLFDASDSLKGLAARKERRGILEPGSYMSGTMRGEDIIRMFDTIGAITKCDDCKIDSHLAQTLSVAASEHEEECLMDECQAANRWRDSREEMVVDLWDHVNDVHTPDGYYFGAHMGDGADYGVWNTEEDG